MPTPHPNSESEGFQDTCVSIQSLTGLDDGAWYERFGNSGGLYGLIRSYTAEQRAEAIASYKKVNAMLENEIRIDELNALANSEIANSSLKKMQIRIKGRIKTLTAPEQEEEGKL